MKDNMEINRSDLREYKRRDYHLPVSHRGFGSCNVIAGKSMTTNISEGGVSFKTKEFIPLVQRLVVEVLLPGTDTPIKAISRVVWIKKDPYSKDQYEIGSQFIDMKNPDRKYLTKVVGA